MSLATPQMGAFQLVCLLTLVISGNVTSSYIIYIYEAFFYAINTELLI
jgi:hypothetical protein